MTRIIWTAEADRALDALSDHDALELFQKLELLIEFPAMYPRRARGRFTGLRYFVLLKRWVVYYRFRVPDEVVVFDVVPAGRP